MEEDIIFELEDGRKIVTTESELKRLILAIRPYVNKFGDIPLLLTKHHYLFRSCDPIWSRQFEWKHFTSTSTNTVLTTNFY